MFLILKFHVLQVKHIKSISRLRQNVQFFNFLIIDDDEADELRRIESEEEAMQCDFLDDDDFTLDDNLPPNPYLSPQPQQRPDENFIMAIECDEVIEISSDDEYSELPELNAVKVEEEDADDEVESDDHDTPTPPKDKKVKFGFLYVYIEKELQNQCGPFAVSDKTLTNLYPRDGFHAFYFKDLVYQAHYINFYM